MSVSFGFRAFIIFGGRGTAVVVPMVAKEQSQLVEGGCNDDSQTVGMVGRGDSRAWLVFARFHA